MTRRLLVKLAPGPLEKYTTRFDYFFRARAQREDLRRYLEKGSCSLPSATNP